MNGFGIPILEAASVGLPIIATNWSGHLDILKDGKFLPVNYELKEISKNTVWEPILIAGSRWACVDEDDAKRKMSKLTRSYAKPKEWAEQLSESVKADFDISVVNGVFADTIKQLVFAGENLKNINPVEYLKSFIDTKDAYNVLYTMPMSTGDVFISTAVIDGLVKSLPADAKIYFATNPKYFDILKGNKQVHKCIPWNESMMHIDLLEEVFDLALTPNVSTQLTISNWVRRGQGRLLAEEFANHCNTELGDYFIERDDAVVKAELLEDASFMTVHPGSGQGQWEARRYHDWNEVLSNLKQLVPNLKVVQVGSADEPKLECVDVDLRGKTSAQQLASVVEKSMLHLGIDSFVMHLAAATNTPLVALFGSSYAKATGPWYKDAQKSKFILLETDNRYGCKKSCYKYSCKENKDTPCVNNISAVEVFKACAKLLMQSNTEQK